MYRVMTVLSACAGALALAGPAQAASWLPETVASGSAGPVDSVDVAIGASGHAAIVWGRKADDGWTRTIHLKRRTPAGVWGPVEDVSTPYVDPYAPGQSPYSSHDRPSVAVDASGNTLITWVSGGKTGPTTQGNLFLEAYAPAGQPVGAQRVFATDANGSYGDARTDVNFGPSGEALITWAEVDQQFHSLVRAADGTYGPETLATMAAGGKGGIVSQDISYGRDGTAVLAWSERLDLTDHYGHRVRVSVRRPGGAWSTPQVLAESPENHGFTIQAGVARDGSAIAAFTPYTAMGASGVRIAALAKDATTFGPSRDLPGVDAKFELQDVVADQPGTASVIGVSGSYSAKRPFVADVTAAGTTATVSAVGRTDMALGPLYPRLAATYDAAGGLHLAWSAAAEDRYGDLWSVYRAFRPAGGSFGTPTRSQNGHDWISDVRLAVSPTGEAISTWPGGSTWRDQQLYVSAFQPGATPPVTTPPTPPVTTPPRPPVTTPPTPPVTTPPTPTNPPATTPTNPPVVPTTPPATPVSTTPPTTAPPVAPMRPAETPTVPTPAVERTATAGGTAQAAASADTLVVLPVLASPEPQAAPTPKPSGSGPSSTRATVSVRSGASCTIPDVRGDTLARAKRRLEKAHCQVGTIRFVKTGRHGRVVRQNTPGAVRRADFPVVLVVARGAR